MPVFTYEEIMQAARQTERAQAIEATRRKLHAKPTPEETANLARAIVDDCPSQVARCRAVPSLKQNTLERVVCALADGFTEIHIGLSGAWSARTAGGASVHAYEKLDYHSGCREFLEAMRAAGCPIVEHGYSVKL